jgi:hypothetical protein
LHDSLETTRNTVNRRDQLRVCELLDTDARQRYYLNTSCLVWASRKSSEKFRETSETWERQSRCTGDERPAMTDEKSEADHKRQTKQ